MNTRNFFGFPIKIEPHEYTDPIHDERKMRDGRPAYAWHNEIQMLRKENRELKESAFKLREQFAVLRIAEWAIFREPVGENLHITIKRWPLVTAQGDPMAELVNNLDKYATVERLQPNHEKAASGTGEKG